MHLVTSDLILYAFSFSCFPLTENAGKYMLGEMKLFRVTAKNPSTKLLASFSVLFYFNWVTQNTMMDANDYFDTEKQNCLKGL